LTSLLEHPWLNNAKAPTHDSLEHSVSNIVSADAAGRREKKAAEATRDEEMKMEK